MGLKQQMKQTLGMTMTPQLQQAIKILQLSVVELQQEVTNALVENPTLEEVSDADSAPEEGSLESQLEIDNVESSQEKLADPQDDHDWTAVLEQGNWNAPMPSTRNMNADDLPSYEQVMTQPTSLYDHLMWQLRMVTDNPRELEIGEEIVGNLNEDGYLMILVEELCEQLKADRAEIEAVLYKIQRFDPPGVAARDLQECLMIQSEVLKEDDEIEVIIQNHMPELETKNYAAIAKVMDLPLERIKELCHVIHDMEPRPGRSFSTTEPQYIVPDIYVVKIGKEFVVVLNEEGIPRLRISKSYQDQLKSGDFDNETKAYIKDKLKGALWLMKSIVQRQRTIFRVTESIVKRQSEFFEKGTQNLRPMVLKDVSDELGLHESTVSRVTTNKFVHTPHGIFELKFFFNSGISTSDGDDMASESVKLKLKELIEGESPQNPLSDMELVRMLGENKINIARRTVAKYREGLGILPSNKRKKYF
jgi:RNA polymerase sigma-54 factor